MKLLDRIFQAPELKDAPPVLVDVGAAGGAAPIWRSIARYSIGIGFEPDRRDTGKLSVPNTAFKRWIYCGIVPKRGYLACRSMRRGVPAGSVSALMAPWPCTVEYAAGWYIARRYRQA